jgi:16S rRNA (guanine527-N7)-methyltransferase
MNVASGTPLAPAPAGIDAAMEPHRQHASWSGLARNADLIGVPLDDVAIVRFARYRDLLVRRGASVNLTAIRDPDEIERRLMLDAIAMLPTLDEVLRSRQGRMKAPAQIIDVGSGAGFPGLALKIARPELNVTLVDATGKKVGFLNEAIAALDVTGVVAIHGRVEELGHDPEFRARFDVATARAVAVLPVLLEYLAPLLRVGGIALLPKGRAIDDELRRGRRAAAMLGVDVISADSLPTGDTRLVVARKIAPTPDDYPRRTGVPSREPLGERR